MRKKETDISLINKYLNGELDAKAMHQLERRAQDDPFLMDALEGYGSVNGARRTSLNEISSRLQQRVTRKERRIIPWRYMAAAALVLVILTVGGLFLYHNKPAGKMQVADLEKSVIDKDTTTVIAPKEAKPDELAATNPQPKVGSLQKTAPKSAPVPVQQRAIMADKMVSSSPPVVKEAAADSAAMTKKSKIIENRVAAVSSDENAKQTETVIHGRAAGAIVDNSSSASRKTEQPKTMVTGRVIEKDHGSPVSGATIIIERTGKTTHTDIDGYFTIHIDSTKDKLYIANSGYESRQISARNKDSLKTIKMAPSTSSLSEVVAVGYGSRKKIADDTTASGAHPNTGWRSFNKYLKKNAVLPDGSTGVVKLSFKVADDGAIINLTVVKGLNAAANQKAIDLIKNGPAWVGNTNGESENVVLRIKFVKAN